MYLGVDNKNALCGRKLENCVEPYTWGKAFCTLTWFRKSKHIKVAQAICGQILAYQISVSPVDVDQLPKYGLAACVTSRPIVFALLFLSRLIYA